MVRACHLGRRLATAKAGPLTSRRDICLAGWAKHAWSNVFAPWNAGATVLVLNYPRFSAGSLLAALGGCGVTTFCAPPTVWRMLIQADLPRSARPWPDLPSCSLAHAG
jgi:acyl-coenzyme A synthetase/AMP-(fatty) acid ligase